MAEDEKIGIVLPPWFLKILGVAISIIAMTCLPWSIWMTRGMMRIEIQMVQFEKYAESLDAVRAEQIKRTGNVAVVEQVQKTVNLNSDILRGLEERLDELEDDLDRRTE